jgi:lipid-A-disaccharide synthase
VIVSKSSPRIFIIAGEASGDLLGADLITQLKVQHPNTIFAGVGGEQMLKAGLPQSLFSLNDLSVMGLIEVLRHLPRLMKRIKQTKQAVKAFKPDLLLTIDSPDFCLRIAKWTKDHLPVVKRVHTVAPTVWAWRPGRAKKIAQFLDGLLCLFPFEPHYFTPHGLSAFFMGHPLAQIIEPLTEEKKQDFFKTYKLDPDRPVVCLLPGSRWREIESLMPIFVPTARRVLQANPDVQIILPTLPHLADTLEAMCKKEFLPVTLMTNHQDKYTAMQISQAALHASGTVALELAFCNTPMITAYKANKVTEWIGRRILTIKYLNLVNLLCNEAIVPEVLQDDCTPEKIAPIIQALLTNNVSAERQRLHFAKVRKELQPDEPAANFVLSFLN